MSTTRFENRLKELAEQDWLTAVAESSPMIHEVDRAATEIWFSFYPLALHKHIEAAEDVDKEMQGFAIKGDYGLSNRIDDSHRFLFGHRFWPDVKHAIKARANAFDETDFDLKEEAELLTKSVATGSKTEDSLVRGMVLIGLMTLAQTGLEKFGSTAGDIAKPTGLLKKSPEKIVAERAKEPKQGLLGFLKTIDKRFKVRWDETESGSVFDIIFDEEIASGAARDQSRDWSARDERCLEGVIPVECRSAACGTCWVGVVGGAENLSDVERLERKQMKVFGYHQGDEKKPVMRLACQAKAEGSVSIVLPHWNGVFGKKIYGLEEVVLEPATKSAEKLRETIANAVSNEK